MGKINRTSGELAVDIARNTGGVRKVRAVFDYID
jgi:osmotically-inducible protein OsmY